MRVKRVALLFICFFCFFPKPSVGSERSLSLVESVWYGERPLVYGTIKSATSVPNGPAACGDPNDTNDRIMFFDVSIFRRITGSSFNPEKVYIYGVTFLGDAAIDVWKSTMPHGVVEVSASLTDWDNTVAICLGLRAWALTAGGFGFSDVVLWYDGLVSLPPADPVTPPPPPSSADLPKLVTAGTSSSAPNLSATVVIEKSNKDEDTNQYVHVGDLYCGIQTKNTTSVSIGSFANKCILYDGLKAGNDSPVVLGSKTVSGLSGGAKTTTHHSFNVKNPSYYTLYGCTNTGSSPPKETKTSDNCGTRTFLAYGIPDVRVQSVVIDGGGSSFPLGSTIAVVTDLANDGDNFIAGTNRKMTVSAELSGCVSTRTVDALEMSDDILSSGASGKTKTFSVTIPPTATPGICIVTIVADPKDELLQTPNKEENRGNNRKSITFQVTEPTPPAPQVPVISVTNVTFINGSHVYTTEKKDISIEVKNSGNAASLPMTGSMFYTPIAGGQDTSIGTFSIEAIPAGGTTTGIIPDVLFSGSGEMTTTVCFDSIPKCWDGGNVYVDTVQSPPGGEDEDGSTIMRLYRGMMQ